MPKPKVLRSQSNTFNLHIQLKQPQAFEALLGRRARYKGFGGGRGSAKSHSIAQALLVSGLRQPLRILCCREIQRSIKDSVKLLLDDKRDAMGLAGFYDSTETQLRGRNGTLFLFAGLRTNPETIQSMEGIDIAWLEEAHRVSQRSLDILLPTIRQEGSEVWCSWNPDSETDPVDQLFRNDDAHGDPDIYFKFVSWRDNPWFPDVLRREMERDKRRDPEKYAHVWEGNYRATSEARVFHNWSIDTFEAPDDAALRYGADWGFSQDPTVLVRCWLDEENRKLFIDHEAYQVGCEIDHTPRLFDTVPGARAWPIRADSARPETISYMRRAGFRMHKAKKGAGSVEDGVEFLKSYDIVVHERCRHTIDELTHYRYKVDPHTDEVLPKLVDKHNHIIDALRYATEAHRRRGHWRPA